MSKRQRGWLKIENRKAGRTWVLRYNVTRKSDNKRVENTQAIGLVNDFPRKSDVWAEVERLCIHQQINKPEPRGAVLFADLALHFQEHELCEETRSITPLATTTMSTYSRMLRNYLIPKWGRRVALGIEPLEIEEWLKSLHSKGLSWPSLDKIRRVMSIVYKHGQRYKLIPRGDQDNPLTLVRCHTTSDYQPVVPTPQQAFGITLVLEEPVRTLTMLVAATGLRISEALGLQWQDVDWKNQKIHVQRRWIEGDLDEPKTRASKRPVPMHPLLAEFVLGWKRETEYGKPGDWVFPSRKMKGKQPRVGSMLSKSLRTPAIAAGVPLEKGQRFGFHNLRHSLASFLVNLGTDVKTVQSLLRHSSSKTTLDIYTHALDDSKLDAQGEILAAMLGKSAGGERVGAKTQLAAKP
jgi:integrase